MTNAKCQESAGSFPVSSSSVASFLIVGELLHVPFFSVCFGAIIPRHRRPNLVLIFPVSWSLLGSLWREHCVPFVLPIIVFLSFVGFEDKSSGFVSLLVADVCGLGNWSVHCGFITALAYITNIMREKKKAPCRFQPLRCLTWTAFRTRTRTLFVKDEVFEADEQIQPSDISHRLVM